MHYTIGYLIGLLVGIVVIRTTKASKRGDRMLGIKDVPWEGKEDDKVKSCKECVAACTGTGKEGNANQCSYHRIGSGGKTAMKRNIKILEISRCGECPNYNPDRDQCTKGAEIKGDNFFEDCPLEEA